MKICMLIGVLLSIIGHSASELYTALADLEELLETEAVLINTLEQYIHAQQEKLNLLRKHAITYQDQHDKAAENVQQYLANPINAYLLVKRLTLDWKQVETLMGTNVGQDFIAKVASYRDHLKFPSDEDLSGAAVALTRLQDTYRLSTASLARGELNGKKYSSELTAADCFELGRQAYNVEDYYHTLLWMREADDRLRHEVNVTIERSDILEYLAFSTFKQGNLMLALELTNKLLEIEPSHQRALGNKQYYEKALDTSVSDYLRKGDDETVQVIVDETKAIKDDSLGDVRELYEQLCRGDVSTPIEITSKLHCHYEDNGNAFLKLAPFKVEVAYPEPKLVIFHDVISDAEIETVKKLAQPRFSRAKVQNSKTGELETAQYRISKSAWLKEIEHKHVAQVCQRVEDMTGLDQATAEELQVVNYGIGGHYEPHYDFARREETNAFKSLGTGNRIATVLFYMSDVEQGGATVFPNIKAVIWPKKGTAAFWYNLFPSGDGDKNTRHAACPVLTGSKWVSNKWIHERGQEFRRPCTLTPPPQELTA